jgi:hypothetical protein
MGKWRYMSPEQTRGDTLDTRSDLFSAASVMFELFTGQKLFPGDEAEDIIKNIETMPIPKANSIRPGLPNRLDEILAGPLARKPIDRPGRPAIVLRQLIELSYESSIMATALDVAEAVAAVLPAKRHSGTGQQLDDVIRKQLGAAQDKSVARRTAVTDGKPPSTATMDREKTSTGLFRKVGKDGISRLEEVETAVAAPRARRASESGEPESGAMTASSPDSGLHKLLDARFDKDRRTEVGGPPTGQVPRSEESPPEVTGDHKSLTTAVSETGSRRGILIVVALVLFGLAGIGVWRFTAKPTPVVAVAKDAAAEEPEGILVIDPEPEGASGTIADENGVTAGTFGPTSHDPKQEVRLSVTANKKFKVHVELAGYNAYDTESTVRPGETLRIAPRLEKASAMIHVETTPPGAQVSLDGKLLGETPLTRAGLDAKEVEIAISKAGYEPQRFTLQLVLGETAQVQRELKESQRFGTIQIVLTGPTRWADVYEKGKSLGSTEGVEGLRSIRLPIGKHELKLVNTSNKKSKTITVDVTEGSQTVRASLD